MSVPSIEIDFENFEKFSQVQLADTLELLFPVLERSAVTFVTRPPTPPDFFDAQPRPSNALFSANFLPDVLIADRAVLFVENSIIADKDLLQRSSLSRAIPMWAAELVNDPDQEFLLRGLSKGFMIVPDVSIVEPAESTNYRSALLPHTKPLLDSLFKAELESGKISRQSHKPIRIQAIGAVEKVGSKEPRPITDCSRPHEDPLNSYVFSESFSFQSVDDVIASSAPGCFYAIVDIKAAYRHVPIFPEHRQLQGFRWKFEGEEEGFFTDNFLCFGVACAPQIFHKISCAISRMMRRKGYVIVSYLDDFLVTAKSYEECAAAQYALVSLLTKLGFSLKWEKIITPSTRVKFLGLVIDSILCRLELPEDKIDKLISMSKYFASKEKVTKKNLQKLAGHFSFAAKALYGARTFSRIFIDAFRFIHRPSHHTRLTAALKNELKWWSDFAPFINGLAKCAMGEQWPIIHIFCDASFAGFGATMQNEWLAGTWSEYPVHLLKGGIFSNIWIAPPVLDCSFHENINFLELVAACLPLIIRADKFKGHRVFIHSDNSATVAFLNRGTSKNAAALFWLKIIFYESLLHNFRFEAVHCPGETNIEADCLSRLTLGNLFVDRFLDLNANNFLLQPGELILCSRSLGILGKTAEEIAAERLNRVLQKNAGIAMASV